MKKKPQKVVPTPFSLDFEEVEKQIVLTLKDNKEQEFYSTAKNIKVDNFCIVLQKIASVFPMWYSKSSTSALIVGIMMNLLLYMKKNFPMVVNLIIRVELFLINLLIKKKPRPTTVVSRGLLYLYVPYLAVSFANFTFSLSE